MKLGHATHHLLPARTLERLVLYRRLLGGVADESRTHVFSYQLARMARNTPAQVRRDLMLAGYSGCPAKGYEVRELRRHIDGLLAGGARRRIALAGVGNLGRAVLAHYSQQNPNLLIAAAFDSDENSVGRVIAGCRCHHVRELAARIRDLDIELGIITVPADQAQEVAGQMVAGGVSGILNFTPVPLVVPGHVVVEDIDITMKLQKIAYLCQPSHAGRET